MESVAAKNSSRGSIAMDFTEPVPYYCCMHMRQHTSIALATCSMVGVQHTLARVTGVAPPPVVGISVTVNSLFDKSMGSVSRKKKKNERIDKRTTYSEQTATNLRIGEY
jgi:hypothetical protein